jgi:uncharacterized protein with GYD domain
LAASRTTIDSPAVSPTGRISFAKIAEPMEVPDLLDLQIDSFDWLVGNAAWRDRVEESDTVIKERGGKLIDVYVTLGRYDVVEIFEAPNDETAYGIVLELARHGTVRTETLRAFTREEAEAIVRGS